MDGVAQAYRGCRERIMALVDGIDPRQARSPVPTCPGWSVHDVVAHLAGGLADVVAGRTDGAGTDERTAEQVATRRDTPLSQVVDEWKTHAAKVEPLMGAAGEIAQQGVADIVSHEHDIRAALGVPGARDSDAVHIGLGFGASRLIASAADRGVTLRVRTTEGWERGPDDADVILTGEPFELLRAITGRRSVDQLRTLEW